MPAGLLVPSRVRVHYRQKTKTTLVQTQGKAEALNSIELHCKVSQSIMAVHEEAEAVPVVAEVESVATEVEQEEEHVQLSLP